MKQRECALTDENYQTCVRIEEATGMPIDAMINQALANWFGFLRRVARITEGTVWHDGYPPA